MVSNIDHTSNTVQEKSAEGEKQNPRTNVNEHYMIYSCVYCCNVVGNTRVYC